MQLKRVVVTGLGALSPIGNDAQTFWQNLLEGKSGAADITKFDASDFKTRFACEVKDFEPLNFIDKREIRRLDTFSQYALVCSDEAIADARLHDKSIDLSLIHI